MDADLWWEYDPETGKWEQLTAAERLRRDQRDRWLDQVEDYTDMLFWLYEIDEDAEA